MKKIEKEIKNAKEESPKKSHVSEQVVLLGRFDKLTEGAGAQYVDGRKNSERQ